MIRNFKNVADRRILIPQKAVRKRELRATDSIRFSPGVTVDTFVRTALPYDKRSIRLVHDGDLNFSPASLRHRSHPKHTALRASTPPYPPLLPLLDRGRARSPPRLPQEFDNAFHASLEDGYIREAALMELPGQHLDERIAVQDSCNSTVQLFRSRHPPRMTRLM